MDKLTRTLLVPLVALCFAGLFTTSAAQAQSVSAGGTLASRYVWRGLDFGDTAAIQPSLSFSQGGFTIGAWGSFEMVGNGINENDLYASYSFDLGDSGSISVSVTDYYFSTGANNFFEFDDNAYQGGPGGHQIEPGISYSGPINVSASAFVFGHDGENEIWLEASYPFSVEDVDLSVALGGTPNDVRGWYGTDADTDAGLTKVSLSASKSIEITDAFSLPISASYYVNPYLARSYFIFGISI